MYKKINNTYSNIHNDTFLLAKYNALSITLKLLHANYAVLTEEFNMHSTVIGAISVTLYTDILDYDLDEVLQMQATNTTMLTAINILLTNAEFANYTQLEISNKLATILNNNASCLNILNEAVYALNN